MSPSSPHGIAIIGLGTVGRRFVEQFGSHDRFTIIGGYDASRQACEAAANDFGIPIADETESLVNDPMVEAVYIAVPPLHHEIYVDQTLAAGKTIFCEKPLGVDDDQSRAMVERVDRSDARAAVNFVFGGAPGAVEMIERVKGGSCGQVVGADLRLHFCRWPRDWQANATWLRDRDQGGWVREVVSHYVFLLNRMFGEATIEYAGLVFPEDGSSEQGLVASLGYGSVPVRLVGTSDSGGPDEVEFTVRGTDRSYRLTNWYQLSSSAGDDTWQPALSPDALAPPAAYRAQLDQVARLVEGHPHSLATFEEALGVQMVVEDLLGGTRN